MQIARGQVYMSLNDKDVEVFYKVAKVRQDESGATWIDLVGMKTSVYDNLPLLVFDKKYMRVSESTAKILFGSKL